LPTFNYVYGPGADAPTIRASSTATQFYHQNGIGNAVAVTNQSGLTDGTATYDVYGNLTASSGTIPTYGFTGREPDETGFTFYARDGGYGVLDSLNFAWRAMAPDLSPSTWSNTQAAQTIHAAGGTPPIGEPFLSPSKVIDAARESASNNFNSPNVSIQMTGIHIVQDIPVHQGEPVLPAETPWWKVALVIGEHIWKDAFISSKVRQQMYEETRAGFATIEGNKGSRSSDMDQPTSGTYSGSQSMGSMSPISR
jgi:hypothetical protein